MLQIITKRLEIYIEINIEISEVDHYTWIFTTRIFRLALEIAFLLNKYFFSYKRRTSYGDPNNSGEGDWKIFQKKNKSGGGGRLLGT